MSPVWDMNERLAFSLGEREVFDIKVLKEAIPGCASIIKTDEKTDKAGIDYVATLKGGAKINIDAKARDKGSARFWHHGEPDLCLERLSVCPEKQGGNEKIGWTLSQSSNVDMILYTFAPTEYHGFYLIPFQHLRMAFLRNGCEWVEKYGYKFQRSNGWRSKAVFVPASIVLNAVIDVMQGKVVI